MMNIHTLKTLLWGSLLTFSMFSCAEGDSFDYNKNVVLVSGTETNPVVKFVVEDTPSSYAVTATSTNKVDEDVRIKFGIDNSLVEAYNEAHSTNYYPVPDGTVEIENQDVVIEKGKTFSTPATVKVISTEGLDEGRVYVIPVTIQQSEGLDVLVPSKTIYLQISRVLHFTSLNISNPELYSNFMFSEDKKLSLSNFTYEIKFYSEEWHSIARMCCFSSADGSRSNMLRFGEAGMDVNCLQWVCPTGSVPSVTRFSTNRWYTLSLTYDGSKFTMYVDGVKDAQLDGDGQPVDFQMFEIGMSWTSYRYSQYFKGRIAEVRVWNRALTPAELQMGLCAVDPHSEGLMAYWKMNEGESYIFHDSTDNGYDMDWSNTCREINEGAGNTFGLDYSAHVAWDADEKNECVQ
ncbi:DUF1735 and LamG domain-containing protein [Phocaeicola sp. KGMB11183]|jgi:hypothetical protein|uniref:DUF1735 and LamG domain-containing protein n=1 Tax=Phocaeicola acetigenes TaxID=3016083 RepID=A0ABT4PH64_9BACT|nr:DUF1735 and LamG domain-containing protein [Phocaeicola sp. KGMB11183]MCZ8372398.1 DUF1735 and LamG domain-containing protein [Phocaeicola sp. KGMB11183]